MTRLAILGSTGSIGRQTLEVVESLGAGWEVVALAAGRGNETLAAQAARWPRARLWSMGARPSWLDADRWAPGGLEELATLEEVDLVVVATTGMAALPAVLAALRSGRRVGLANKETLVTGGHLVTAILDELGGDPMDLLRPIDSEHSAIWQCLVGEPRESVERLILTASGGPFRGRAPTELSSVTPEQALAHPTWRMGPKITIDSATLVNKAFEVIEARWLYRLPYSKIEAVIHPQSVVHSLVAFADGSYKAQLGMPDMRLPIQYALTYPERRPSPARSATPAEWGSLEFAPLDPRSVPAYATCLRAAEAGGNRGTILNAADEVAVTAFLAGRLPLPAIAETIESAIERWGADDEPSLDEIGHIDTMVRTELDGSLPAATA